MFRQHYLDALEVVLAWDLSETAVAEAINHQIMQNSEFEEDTNWAYCSNSDLSFRH